MTPPVELLEPNRIAEVSGYADALVDAVADGILAVDFRLTIVSANRSAGRVFGRTTEELIGQPLLDFLPELKDQVPSERGQILPEAIFGNHDGSPLAITARVDGLKTRLELTATATEVADENVWVILVRDVTEIHSSHATLLQAHRELEEFNRLAVGRERRMIELKLEINAMLTESGQAPRYDIVS